MKPSSIAKPMVKQQDRISAFIMVIASLARLPPGTQKQVSRANPNGAARSQFAGLYPAASSVKARHVISNIGGARNDKTAAIATPRQTLIGIIGEPYTTNYWQTLAPVKRSESRFHSSSAPRYLDARVVPDPSPSPLPVGRGEGERPAACLTQGGARSSLTLGYNQVTPTGFQIGCERYG